MTVTSKNCIHKTIKSNLDLGNASCCTMHFKILVFPIATKNIKTEAYETIILPVKV